MSKFNHLFEIEEIADSFVQFAENGNTARLDFVSDSCIRVAMYKDKADLLPTFCVNPNSEFSAAGRDRLSTDGFEGYCASVNIADGICSFELADGIKAQINPDNFLITYYKNDCVLFSDRAPLAYNFENEFGSGMYHYISRMSKEKIFGLGDKGGAIDKAGRSFRFETTDCMGYDAKESDPLYKHIPFYICENSVGSYGIFYDTSDTSYIDLGKEINNYYEPYKYFKTEDNCLVYYVFFGTKLSILQQFARLCGKHPFPPKWSFDYCASTMAYTDAPESQKRMNDFIEKLREYNLSCGGFYLSSGYTSIGSQRYVFNWNEEKFPDVKGFVSDFADKGIEIIPNIKPAFLINHPLYNYIAEKGWFVKNPDSTPFITEFWDGYGSYLDFTNSEAFDFWSDKVSEALLDYGITATWNDNNEFDIKDIDAVAYGFGGDAVKASRIRPVLTYLMNASSYKAQITKNPDLRPFLSTRSGGIGVRRFAQTWSGDNRTDFSDLRYCHNIGLTMSMSGLYFYGHDLGGFSGDMPSRELLLRWLQHGIFEPRLTIHSWNSDGSATMPWSYPDIAASVYSLFAQRKQLSPYMYNCAYNAVESEIPINAPAFLYYNDDELYRYTDSMMFGKDILVAFAFDEGVNEATAFLPSECDWYLGDKKYSGGQLVKLNISPEDKMPYFVRGGCVLPTDEADYGFCKNEIKIVFTVYPLDNGTYVSEFFDDDGKSFGYLENSCVRIKFTVECNEEVVSVTVENTGNNVLDAEIRLCSADRRTIIVNK